MSHGKTGGESRTHSRHGAFLYSHVYIKTVAESLVGSDNEPADGCSHSVVYSCCDRSMFNFFVIEAKIIESVFSILDFEVERSGARRVEVDKIDGHGLRESVESDGVKLAGSGVAHVEMQTAHHLGHKVGSLDGRDFVGKVGRRVEQPHILKGIGFRAAISPSRRFRVFKKDSSRACIDRRSGKHIIKSDAEAHGKRYKEPIPVADAYTHDVHYIERIVLLLTRRRRGRRGDRRCFGVDYLHIL